MTEKQDIKNLNLSELREILQSFSEAPYRAEQIWYWLYTKGVTDFKAMQNIPQNLRNMLAQHFYIGTLALKKKFVARDKAQKFIFRLRDSYNIETVLIPSEKRTTVCISTQIGCKNRCIFCASGMHGFKRDLSVSEIITQIIEVQKNIPQPITHIVIMGIGEPFDNYHNVLKAINTMHDPKGLHISSRRISISTCGIIPAIEKIAVDAPQVNLSISFHSAVNAVRNKLVPINRRYPIEKLIAALQKYYEKTKRRITLEYILFDGINDTKEDADMLSKIAHKLKALINIIPYNEVHPASIRGSSESQIQYFIHRLELKQARVTQRQSKGSDINAACGQLAYKL